MNGLLRFDSQQLPDQISNLFDPTSLFTLSELSNHTSSRTVVKVPVGSCSDLPNVELGTMVTIILSFLYVAYVSQRTFSRVKRPFGALKED